MARNINNTTISLASRRRLQHRSALTSCLAAVVLTSMLSGCSTILGNHSVSGVPVSRVPSALLDANRKDDFEDTSLLRLRQDPPAFYALGPGDVLGVYVKGILGNEDQLPPVHYREDSSLPPAVGFPVPVRDDGTLALPIVDPITVEGMSLIEATEAVRKAYTGGAAPVLADTEQQISLTMIRRRTVRVLVIREEAGGIADVTKRGTGQVVDLPAYENDVLHALSETGGLPGLDAQNQVLVLRGMYDQSVQYDQAWVEQYVSDCDCNDDPCFCHETERPDPPNTTRIPLRYHPSRPPQFSQDDILLSDGDILIIRSRDRETFYTAGLLGAGEHQLPRDKDLDIIGAIALAGGPLGQGGTGISALGQGGGGGGGLTGGGQGGGGGIFQPSEALVIRELPCGNQITLKVDLNRALQNRGERILIQPGDVVMLRYTIGEEVANVVLSLVQFNFLFSGLNGGGF